MNRVPGSGGAQDGWAGLIGAVAAALAGEPVPGETSPCSLLAAVAAIAPAALRRQVQRQATRREAAGRQAEPLVHQNELPVVLLASGIVRIAAEAVDAWHKTCTCTPGPGEGQPDTRMPGQPDARVLGITAISALSTLRLHAIADSAVLAQVRRGLADFGTPCWAEALGSLASRTSHLRDLLTVRSTRSQQWHDVTLEDRILAEAAAAAVVGGAAAASGVPPQRWLFPFHLFCKLAVSAAEDALGVIERWLGIDFLPAPWTAERSASLAVLCADQAASLWQGCACKTGAGTAGLAFTPRGQCRQPDHDLRSWEPGAARPGSHAGAGYATTLWGWLRRWLGGTAVGRAASGGQPRHSRPHPNDVAGSVLARKWLCTDRGAGGPVLFYDRILPEFCLRCGSKVKVTSHGTPGDRMQVERACCSQPQRVYRSDFTEREGRRLPRPKLGIVIVFEAGENGRAGYFSTAPLGPLWLCRASGRYSRSQRYCPACGPGPGPGHEPVPYGWVLLPHEQAWQDLKDTAHHGDGAGPPAAAATVSEADLRLLEEIFAKLEPGMRARFATPSDVWEAAREFSIAETDRFRELGEHSLELLLRCKEIAEETSH